VTNDQQMSNNNSSNAAAAASAGYFENMDPSTEQQPMPPLNAREQQTYNSLARIQYWMDESIKLPCCKQRIGLDPILGVIPFIGDFGSALVSLTFVMKAAPVLSRYTVVRMLVNVWIDTTLGTVPLIGDIFDIGWKANQRNLLLFENHMKVGKSEQARVDQFWVFRAIIIFIVVCAFTAMLVLALFILLILWLTGNL
jgi:hypothetical protein